ncbi:hypothetical protein MBGDC06_00020 [Thermoplasmatales archaeon SCGC AB-539-C06]|nr:hypothetical protein MBGDC06_00020 [Thermoplasmatales archaeon SCGC AB-539-C06]
MTTGLYKKGLVLAIIGLFIGASVIPVISGNNNFNGPPEKEWDKTFGGSDGDSAYCVQQINDGGYILTGNTYSYGAGRLDCWLVKTDSSGNKLWDKTFGGTDDDAAYCVQQTNDDGYILSGFTGSYGAGNADCWLVRTDSSGNKLWDNTYGGTDDEAARCVQQTNDGGYILTGDTDSFGAGNADCWLVRTDSSGNKLWDKTYGGTEWDCAYCVQQTNDGGYILTGETFSYGAGVNDCWLVKTDSSGNKLWDKTFGGTDDDAAYCVQQTNDDGYIVAGSTRSYGAGESDFWLIKTDSSGNKLWDKTYGGIYGDHANCVQQTNDGGYILAGGTTSYGAGDGDFWLIKTDSSGNKLWDKTYGGIYGDHANCVQQTNDGGYILAGSTGYLWGVEDYDVWLVKLSSESDEDIIIEIHGGFRVSADITNTGSETLTDVNWSIDLDGGLILAGEHTEGVIDEFAPGATTTIRQTTLYGIGMTTITVTAGDATEQATGFILGPLVLGVKEIS